MHTFTETGAGVPAFLAKLWRLVEDPETNHLIYWNKDGRSFIIQNQAQFARELLPLNYKHNNMASFIRQLNMYGFHKITSIDNGGLKFDRDEMEFSHPCFKRGHPYLLEHIKRKIATAKTTIDEKGLMKPEAVNKVLSEVKAMRGRQDSLDSRFSVMKQENEALWREIASLRQKHMKQQQIVNKLIQFLVTIVQPSRSNMSGVKRHFQLMINDVPQSPKLRKKSESESGTGPVIHELTEELLDEVANSDTELSVSSPSVLSHGDVSNVIGSDLIDETGSDNSPNISNFDQPTTSVSKNNELSARISSDNVVYHVSEVPDNTELESNFIEENVLNTPMVKKELARMQKEKRLKLLKQKEKKQQRLIQPGTSGKKRMKLSSAGQQNFASTLLTPIKIKIEKDIDPLLFLDDVSNDVSSDSIDPSLISLNTRVQDTTEITNNLNQQAVDDDVCKELYGAAGDFITPDMPSDLFEDSSMINDIDLTSESYNNNIDLRKKSNVAATDVNSPSAGSSKGDNTDNVAGDDGDGSSFLINKSQDSEKNMTLAKYNTPQINDDDIMRLSTAEEFTNHLENVQDDLDNLRDVLRSEGYSLDANTLLGNSTSANRLILSSPLDGDLMAKLFSDSDVLTAYGLSISNENSQDIDKKDKLMAYQPYYADFSEILNANNEFISKPTESYDDKVAKTPASTSSVLNTPYHE